MSLIEKVIEFVTKKLSIEKWRKPKTYTWWILSWYWR